MPAILFCHLLWASDVDSSSAATGQTGQLIRQASIIELLGETAAEAYAPIMPIDELIEWELYVPPTYDPAKPPGLLVYISPQDSGRIRRVWKSLMVESNLIWVAANHSGNKVDPRRRIVYSLMAVALVARDYKVATERLYLTGFSGGGRIASMVATKYPSIFKGSIYNCGVNFWDEVTPVSLELIKTNRFVFVTGSDDFNLRDTKRVFRAYEKAGVQQIKLMVIPFMGHSNPDKHDFAKAIEFLDGHSAVPEKKNASGKS